MLSLCNDEVKFVLTDRADYDFARAFIAEHDLRRKSRRNPLQPGIFKVARAHCVRPTMRLSTRAPWSNG